MKDGTKCNLSTTLIDVFGNNHGGSGFFAKLCQTSLDTKQFSPFRECLKSKPDLIPSSYKTKRQTSKYPELGRMKISKSLVVGASSAYSRMIS